MDPEDYNQEHPKGALTVALIYIVLLVLMWSWTYLTLLERGVTQ